MLYAVLASPFLLVGGWFFINHIRRKRRQQRRARLSGNRLSAAWRDILWQKFELYRRLPESLQQKLEGHIQIFLDEKVFVGCDGFEITDEVRLLIAAQACLLILNVPTDYYPRFKSILVYPHIYETEVSQREGFVKTDSRQLRAGESWRRGPVVLAWDSVLYGAVNGRDGGNVVFHEFSHKLDEEDAVMDGTPLLASGAQYQAWVDVFFHEFEDLVHRVSSGRPHDIDAYAAQSPAEFFAVVSEMFFEKPGQLHRHHPQLYEQLKDFYNLDPLLWQHSAPVV